LILDSSAILALICREHVSIFLEACLRYGRGRHPARLNMGYCFTYASAKIARQPVLFVGDGFSRTDITAA
jgi:ribonuclease VapC